MRVALKRPARSFLAFGILWILSFFCTPARAQETPSQIVDQAHAAHGGRWTSGETADWIYEGTITYFMVRGTSQTFDVTIYRKGKSKLQRIVRQPSGELRQGSDGLKTWQSMGGLSSVAHSGLIDFIDSETSRSLQNLFSHRAESLTLGNLGVRTSGTGIASGNSVLLLEARDRNGKATRYFLNETNSLIVGLEFDIGEQRDPFSGKVTTAIEVYAFSDFRNIQGVQTPFKIERYRAGVKAEEIRLNSARYNTGVKDEQFKR